MNDKLIQSLAKLAKVSDVEAFSKALQSESDTDFQLVIDNLVVNTKDELKTMKDNVANATKAETFKAASEITIKNMKKEVGLEFDGKDPKEFISKFKENILNEAKIEPNKKIQEQEQSILNLQKLVSDKDSEISTIKDSYAKESRLSTIKGLIPKLPEGIGITQDEALSLVTLGLEFKEDGIYKNGQILKDEMESPITIEKHVETYVAEKGWNKTPQGRGGGSGSQGGGTKPNSLEDFNNLAAEKGYSVGSADYNALLNETVKENPSLLEQ